MMCCAPFSRRTSVRVSAGWGAPIDYKPAKVVSSAGAGDELVKLVIDVGSTIAAGYTVPGQYVMLRLGEAKPGFFAIASTPAASAKGHLELLIKRPAAGAANVAELLAGLKAGDALEVSPVQGKGFPVDRIPTDAFPNVLLFATGTGISPIKALIESGALGKRKDVRLFYGTRNTGSTAYAHLVDSWRDLGVTVTHVYSDDKGGYVQDAFAAGGAGVADPSATGAVVCGHGDMCKAVTALLGTAGVAADKVLMNY